MQNKESSQKDDSTHKCEQKFSTQEIQCQNPNKSQDYKLKRDLQSKQTQHQNPTVDQGQQSGEINFQEFTLVRDGKIKVQSQVGGYNSVNDMLIGRQNLESNFQIGVTKQKQRIEVSKVFQRVNKKFIFFTQKDMQAYSKKILIARVLSTRGSQMPYIRQYINQIKSSLNIMFSSFCQLSKTIMIQTTKFLQKFLSQQCGYQIHSLRKQHYLVVQNKLFRFPKYFKTYQKAVIITGLIKAAWNLQTVQIRQGQAKSIYEDIVFMIREERDVDIQWHGWKRMNKFLPARKPQKENQNNKNHHIELIIGRDTYNKNVDLRDIQDSYSTSGGQIIPFKNSSIYFDSKNKNHNPKKQTSKGQTPKEQIPLGYIDIFRFNQYLRRGAQNKRIAQLDTQINGDKDKETIQKKIKCKKIRKNRHRQFNINVEQLRKIVMRSEQQKVLQDSGNQIQQVMVNYNTDQRDLSDGLKDLGDNQVHQDDNQVDLDDNQVDLNDNQVDLDDNQVDHLCDKSYEQDQINSLEAIQNQGQSRLHSKFRERTIIQSKINHNNDNIPRNHQNYINHQNKTQIHQPQNQSQNHYLNIQHITQNQVQRWGQRQDKPYQIDDPNDEYNYIHSDSYRYQHQFQHQNNVNVPLLYNLNYQHPQSIYHLSQIPQMFTNTYHHQYSCSYVYPNLGQYGMIPIGVDNGYIHQAGHMIMKAHIDQRDVISSLGWRETVSGQIQNRRNKEVTKGQKIKYKTSKTQKIIKKASQHQKKTVNFKPSFSKNHTPKNQIQEEYDNYVFLEQQQYQIEQEKTQLSQESVRNRQKSNVHNSCDINAQQLPLQIKANLNPGQNYSQDNYAMSSTSLLHLQVQPSKPQQQIHRELDQMLQAMIKRQQQKHKPLKHYKIQTRLTSQNTNQKCIDKTQSNKNRQVIDCRKNESIQGRDKRAQLYQTNIQRYQGVVYRAKKSKYARLGRQLLDLGHWKDQGNQKDQLGQS